MKKFFVALVATVALLVMPTTAAHAYGVLGDADTVAPGVGYPITLTGLATNDPVTFRVEGPGTAGISLAAIVEQTFTPVDNALSTVIDFPEAGEYVISVLQNDELIGSMTVTVAVVPDDAPAGGSNGGELGETGFASMPVLWFGAGVLVLGVALVTTMTVVRRNAKLPASR